MRIKKFNEDTKCFILHGMPSKAQFFDKNSPSPSNFCWYPWLQKQLCLNNILSQTLEFPKPYEPDYNKWKSVIQKFDLKDSIVIGHSCGGGFILRYLSENNIKAEKIILIAPWLDPNKDLKNNFFDFNLKNLSNVYLYYSTDDDKDILDTVEMIKKKIKNIQIRKFTNKEHFTFKKFPEILDDII